jgi:hypothetical protein
MAQKFPVKQLNELFLSNAHCLGLNCRGAEGWHLTTDTETSHNEEVELTIRERLLMKGPDFYHNGSSKPCQDGLMHQRVRGLCWKIIILHWNEGATMQLLLILFLWRREPTYWTFHYLIKYNTTTVPIPVAAQFKAWVYCHSLAGSNPAVGMDVCLLWVFCVVR